MGIRLLEGPNILTVGVLIILGVSIF